MSALIDVLPLLLVAGALLVGIAALEISARHEDKDEAGGEE